MSVKHVELAELRFQKGLTLKQLSDVTGLSISYLSKIELGLRQGSPQTLKLIAEALDVNLDDIFDFDAMHQDRGTA